MITPLIATPVSCRERRGFSGRVISTEIASKCSTASILIPKIM